MSAGSADFDAVKAQLDNDGVVLDVRNRDELESSGQIKGTHCVPLPEVDSAFSLDDDAFKTQYGFDKPSTDATVITHCQRGGRAQKAADALIAKGYSDVKVYCGSFSDWKSQGGETLRPGEPFRPE